MSGHGYMVLPSKTVLLALLVGFRVKVLGLPFRVKGIGFYNFLYGRVKGLDLYPNYSNFIQF